MKKVENNNSWVIWTVGDRSGKRCWNWV